MESWLGFQLFSILFFSIFLHQSNSAHLKPRYVVSSNEIDVATSRIAKRSPGDSEYLDLQLNVNGEVVTKRLRKLGERDGAELTVWGADGVVDDPTGPDDVRDWAVYGHDGGEASLLVSDHPQHGVRLEGSLRHNKEDYVIQPVDDSANHVIHKVAFPDFMTKRDIPKHMLERMKRAPGAKMDVEIHFVFDNSFYRNFRTIVPRGQSAIELIREYYGLLINEMNYRFQSFKAYGMDVNIVMGGLTIFTNYNKSPYDQNRIRPGGTGNGLDILGSFEKWVNANMRVVDDVQLHSHYTFDGIKGVAWLDSLCTNRAVNILQDDRDFVTAHVAGHELGHNMGIRHDDGTADCMDNYMMNPIAATPIRSDSPLNAWKFSQCSAKHLKEYVNWLETGKQSFFFQTFKRTQKGNCMLTHTESHPTLTKYGKTLPGADMTLDQQCNRIVKGSKFCAYSQMRFPIHKICYNIYCTNPNKKQGGCRPRFSFPGTPCGEGKICIYGECKKHAKGKPMNEKCPYGDVPGKFIGKEPRKSCKEAIPAFNGYCYKREPHCCESCGKVKVNDAGNCTYGDRPTNITVSGEWFGSCADAIAKYPGVCYKHAKICCKSCAALYKPKNVGCEYGNQPGRPVYSGDKEVTCEEAITKDDASACYERGNRRSCCATCAKFKRDKQPGCDYGDKEGKPVTKNDRGLTCREGITSAADRGHCYSYDVARRCCETCPKYKGKGPSCVFGDKVGKHVVFDGKVTTCQDSIKSEADKGVCYGAEKACCETCPKYKGTDPKCAYGDKAGKMIWVDRRLSTCRDAMRQSDGNKYCYRYAKDCCESCKKFETTSKTCKYGDKDKRMCESEIKRNPTKCYDAPTRDTCCITCPKYKTNVVGCEFGNSGNFRGTTINNRQYRSCKDAVAKSSGVCYNSASDCCMQCAPIKKAGNAGCEYGDRPQTYGLSVGREKFADCAAAAKKYPGMCYTRKRHCCETCGKLENKQNAGCEYGDYAGTHIYIKENGRSVHATCAKAITSAADAKKHCTGAYVLRNCCASCKKFSSSTSARSYNTSYKTDASIKRSLLTSRPSMSSSSYGSSVYGITRSTYTTDALSRPLPRPSDPLGRNTRTLKSDFGVKPRTSSISNIGGPVRAEHAKYSVIKDLYDTPGTTSYQGDYGTKRDTRSQSLYNRQRNTIDGNSSSHSITERTSGRVSPSSRTPKSGYVKDSVDELLGRNSRSRRSTLSTEDHPEPEPRAFRDDADVITKSLSSTSIVDNQTCNSNARDVSRNTHASSSQVAHCSTSAIGEQYHNGGKLGLKNLGNTCFMNSILQILSNTRILLEYCLRGDYKTDTNKRSPMNGSLMTSYADLIKHLWTDMVCVSPNSFKSQIQRFAPRFMGYQQQDAQEFLRYLLEGLHEDVNRVTARQKPYTQNSDEDDKLSDTEKAKEYWRRYLRRDDSKIVEIFVGQLRSELKFSCGHRSVTFDPFWDLSVSIPRVSSDVSITDCLAQFMRDEELDPAETPTCSKCKARRSCRKSFSIQKFPQILVLHLKRFSQEMFRRKLNTLVDFPNTLDLSAFAAERGCGNTTYTLYGVCNHSGGTHSGHYTAYSCHPYSQQWYCYNDSRVSSARASDIATSEAYVLFYELSKSRT